MMHLFSQLLQDDGTALILYFVGMAIVIAIIFASVYVYAYYNKLLSRLPDAVKFKNLQTRINMLESKRDDLTKELDELKKSLSESRGLVEEVENAKKWLQDNKLTIPQLESEITDKRNEYDKVSKILQEESDKLQEKRKELLELEQILAEKRLSIAAAEKEAIKILEATVKHEREAAERIKGLSDKAEQLIVEINQYAAKALSAKTELERIAGCLEQAKGKLAEIEKEIEKKRNELEDKGKEVGRLRGEKAAIEGAVEAYNKAIDTRQQALTKTLDDLAVQVKVLQPPNLDTRLEDLYRPVISDPPRLLRSIEDEISWIDNFYEELKEGGILFPKRAIYAFHTSLKIADSAPLLVLAGISGTGKSLLPQFYANAIGMNFLPIAVQPRWDGPQDLFGFYNYMEHRFKATELSRLLWQQDRYNNPDGDDSLQKGMTLVLLDEMNLARVEYYFSDMLSKLELRRNIDPEDDDSRGIAEIEIEAGSLLRDECNKRLFVGSNILFVGTMNEDETTQNLSDKVIDRSNMLRFGKPQHTDSKPDTEELLKDIKANGMLSERLWSGWFKNGLTDGNSTKMLTEYLEKINHEMSNVGKPFGHRLHQAVSSYVANYPGNFNDAVADQIEMKLLPKLNGLEQGAGKTEQLYNTIKDIIIDLGDENLLDAFEKATDESKPFFEWRGVSRID